MGRDLKNFDYSVPNLFTHRFGDSDGIDMSRDTVVAAFDRLGEPFQRFRDVKISDGRAYF
jgi:hypothetical protein